MVPTASQFSPLRSDRTIYCITILTTFLSYSPGASIGPHPLFRTVLYRPIVLPTTQCLPTLGTTLLQYPLLPKLPLPSYRALYCLNRPFTALPSPLPPLLLSTSLHATTYQTHCSPLSTTVHSSCSAASSNSSTTRFSLSALKILLWLWLHRLASRVLARSSFLACFYTSPALGYRFVPAPLSSSPSISVVPLQMLLLLSLFVFFVVSFCAVLWTLHFFLMLEFLPPSLSPDVSSSLDPKPHKFTVSLCLFWCHCAFVS